MVTCFRRSLFCIFACIQLLLLCQEIFFAECRAPAPLQNVSWPLHCDLLSSSCDPSAFTSDEIIRNANFKKEKKNVYDLTHDTLKFLLFLLNGISPTRKLKSSALQLSRLKSRRILKIVIVLLLEKVYFQIGDL